MWLGGSEDELGGSEDDPWRWVLPPAAHLSYDLRQWVPLSEFRLIHEARLGRSSELQYYGNDPGRLVRSIWHVAWENRSWGGEPRWVWLWRPAG